MDQKTLNQRPSASLWRQLAAMLYDSLLIMALLFVVTAVLLIFNDGEAIENSHFYSLFLLATIFVFYGWFWTRSGQTLGMQVWKIKIIAEVNHSLTWPTCLLRLVFALVSILCFGLGYWWRLFKPYTWHDHLSQTRIVDAPSLPK